MLTRESLIIHPYPTNHACPLPQAHARCPKYPSSSSFHQAYTVPYPNTRPSALYPLQVLPLAQHQDTEITITPLTFANGLLTLMSVTSAEPRSGDSLAVVGCHIVIFDL